MWGYIITEANTLSNFNFGFSTYKSDILIHLSQWQYWWWFWFSLFWTVYFFIIIRVLTKRTFSFNPTLNTSVRGHGKWGDFLVALIPLSWCGNILVNSNFILRMIEWQNESSLFTIRVQGKQWYWVYKYDASAVQSIFNAPKNIGNNRWVVIGKYNSYTADNYYQALHLGTQIEFNSLYYKYLNNESLDKKTLNNLTNYTINEGLETTSNKNFRNINKSLTHKHMWLKIKYLHTHRIYEKSNKALRSVLTRPRDLDYLFEWDSGFGIKRILSMKPKKEYKISKQSFIKYKLSQKNIPFDKNKQIYSYNENRPEAESSFYDFSQLDDLSNFASNVAQNNSPRPLIILRGTLNKINIKKLHHAYESEYTDKQFEFKYRKKINDMFEKEISKRNMLRNSKTLALIDKIEKKRKKNIVKLVLWELNDYEFKKIKNTKNTITEAKIKEILKKRQAIKKIKTKNVVYFNKWVKLRSKYYEKVLNTGVIFLYWHMRVRPHLFSSKFIDNNTITSKVEDVELFWGFRQKKYKRLQKFIFKDTQKYNRTTLLPEIKKKQVVRVLKNNLIKNFENKDNTEKITFNYQNSIKFNKHRSELVPVNLARRLLRTKRTLVLPAHVNITLISSSYDVVHSWFIPGLGLKIDCVPGRSTHHSFYIDNVGFYYGQCAEICGRYHHHMPIRLCALSFDHFLVWWNKKGLRRLHRLTLLSKTNKNEQHILNQINGTTIITGKGLDLNY